jgi:N-acetylglucosaminyl-diphospho-decaprenol L-rhamnosyltransferase
VSVSLDITIVNRNSGRLLGECLASIAAANKMGFVLRRVSIVDDASSDSSLSGIAQLPLPLQITRNDTHSGYGTSCNRGASGSTADYLLFLNTDTLLSASSLVTPICYMEQPEHERVGIVGIQLLDSRGRVSRSCSRFPTFGGMAAQAFGLDRIFPSLFPNHFMTEWDHQETREVDQVMGAFMLVRRPVFERLGGYDEQFFVYMDDLDFAMRTRRLGYLSVYLSSSAAFHEGGGTSRHVKAESLFFLMRSRVQYAFKHFGRLQGWMILALTLSIEPISRTTLTVWRRSWNDLRATIKSSAMLWKVLPSLMPKDKLRRTTLPSDQPQPHSPREKAHEGAVNVSGHSEVNR